MADYREPEQIENLASVLCLFTFELLSECSRKDVGAR